MKTATLQRLLLLTNAAETARAFADICGEQLNLIVLPAPGEASRTAYNALFVNWLRMVDAVIIDAASLAEAARFAVETLSEKAGPEAPTVIVRASSSQQSALVFPSEWLVVSENDLPAQLRQSVATFLELREVQSKLKRADELLGRQTVAGKSALPVRPLGAPISGSPATSAESHRYRDALKNVSHVLGQPVDAATLLTEFARLMRELLGVGKLALFIRPMHSDLFAQQVTPAGNQLTACGTTGIAPQVVEHLRLNLDSGLGGFLSREARILRRAQAMDPLAAEHDPQILREFELLGTEVAVPMYDHDQLLGVLTFSGRITGEHFASDELELIYHLLVELVHAIRSRHLQGKVAGQQRFMAEVLANIQSGVVAIGAQERVLCLNRHARALLDIHDENIVGQRMSQLPSRVSDMLYEVLQTGREIHGLEVVLPRTNRPLSVSATRFNADLGEGEQAVVVALIDDLTQIRLQQAQARELADREFFQRLSYRLSHELKNSLAAIKTFAQLLPEQYTQKDFRDQFSSIVTNEVNRVDVLVNNLTFFSQTLVLVTDDLVLGDLVEACIKNVSDEFARKKVARLINHGDKAAEGETLPVVTVKRNFNHKLARVAGDRIRLMQAFEHVLRNAVQFMPTGGRILISTSDAQPADFPSGELPVGGGVKIEWQDTGEGIALENLKRVTEPFVTTRNVGVGLGLTIVKKIVERHTGRLEIDSLLGRGTTVSMVLPVKAQTHADDVRLAAVTQQVNAGAMPTGKDPNRLVHLQSTPKAERGGAPGQS